MLRLSGVEESALMERTFRDKRALGSKQDHVYSAPGGSKCRHKKVK